MLVENPLNVYPYGSPSSNWNHTELLQMSYNDLNLLQILNAQIQHKQNQNTENWIEYRNGEDICTEDNAVLAGAGEDDMTHRY